MSIASRRAGTHRQVSTIEAKRWTVSHTRKKVILKVALEELRIRTLSPADQEFVHEMLNDLTASVERDIALVVEVELSERDANAQDVV